jgi:hypothetical protein
MLHSLKCFCWRSQEVNLKYVSFCEVIVCCVLHVTSQLLLVNYYFCMKRVIVVGENSGMVCDFRNMQLEFLLPGSSHLGNLRTKTPISTVSVLNRATMKRPNALPLCARRI